MGSNDGGAGRRDARQGPGRGAALRHLLKLAVGLAIVGFLLARYDARGVLDAIAAADRASLALAWCCALPGIACFALAYRLARRPLEMPLRTWSIFKILLQVQFFGLFLPGGTNAVVKWYKLSRPADQPGQSLALVAFTRGAMTLTLLLLVLAGMLADPGFRWPGLFWLALTLLVLTVAFLLVCVSDRARERFRRLVGPLWRRLHLLAAFGRLRPLEFAGVVGATLAGNLLETLEQLLIMHAVGIEVSFATVAWARGILIVCAMLPVSLAGLGLRELSMIALLAAYGYGAEDAMAYSLIAFGVFIVGKGLIGGMLELSDWLRPAGC
jgi:uncharacterized membrane protein YbhN (UPF0104 family)